MTSGKPCKINLEAFGGEGTMRAEAIKKIVDGNYCVIFKETRTIEHKPLVLRKGKIAVVPGWAVSFDDKVKP